MRRVVFSTLAGLAAAAGPVAAQPAKPAAAAPLVAPLFTGGEAADLVPAAGGFRPRSPATLPCPPAPCPPVAPLYPPGTQPQPGTPGMPPSATDPNAPQNPVSNLQNPFAQATEA